MRWSVLDDVLLASVTEGERHCAVLAHGGMVEGGHAQIGAEGQIVGSSELSVGDRVLVGGCG